MKDTAVSNEVIVGIDPRRQSVPALAWAVDEAVRRRLALRLVVAVPPLPGGQHIDAAWRRTMLRVEGEGALADAVATVRALHAEVPLATELLDGVPSVMLCQKAAEARMVVVGSRRLSRPEEFLSAASVAVPVSAQANCPVVVVREPEHVGERHPHLVVGVDGSESSRTAVEFAVEEAALHGAALRAVWVWRRPVVSFGDEAVGLEERQRILSETVAGWADKYPDVEITLEVLRGHPVEELARASAGALVVVVGRHGRGGYSGMRLGSVVHGLLHRAECPVITVPESRHG
ncbi:universal stress protein [Streptomyces sp. NBC_01281]|uniref:universal stress protein n=1 Tax=unclassified Streptomyces TaxID=2593676 RepID=UPI0022587449|nr:MULTISPECIES: universal stress protein [unclassified Streptomyces]MCX4913117.1 universal stress protein [Streptomyces sp. NBC_00687]WSK64773.1 universal stress protein [Streptomyces sp. NBC_01281]